MQDPSGNRATPVNDANDVRRALDILTAYHQRERYLTTCYIAFGINCSEKPGFSDFTVTTPVQFGISKSDSGDHKVITDLKAGFGSWVIASGFGHLVGILTSYLHGVYVMMCFLSVKYYGRKIDIKKMTDRFAQKGVNEQIRILQEQFELAAIYSDVLSTLNNVRNCIIHRRGFVSHRDVTDMGKLVLRWKGIDLEKIVRGQSEKIPENLRGQILQKGDEVLVSVVMKEKRFEVGTKIELSAQEIGEICWCLSGVLQDIHEKALAKADDAIREGKAREIPGVGISLHEIHP